MSARIIIEPQRATGRGWQPCLDHQAGRFALILERRYRRGRQPVKTRKFLASYTSKAQAWLAKDEFERRAEGPRRPYKLGRRMEPRA